MKILLFHPVRLPPRDYGGVERVVLWLSEALRDLGHDVSVAALPGSVLPPGVRLVPFRADQPFQQALNFDAFDLIHFHSPPARDAVIPIPYVVTIHGNGRAGETFLPNTLFLSSDHARRHGRAAFVFNGVNPGEFRPRYRERRSAKPLFLSKTSWKVKNLAAAMRFSKAAGTGLTIAGGYRPISLLLKSALYGFDWAGSVAGASKAAVLSDASCLVFPVRWPEPFGLVMVESMMSGTPVFGSRIGSVPEVVGESGGRVLDLEDTAGWIHALQSAHRTDREAIRASAMEKFTHWKMAEAYLKFYSKALRGENFQ